MTSLLAKGQKVVDSIVAQSNCETTNDKLRLNHFLWLIVLATPLSVAFIIKNILINDMNIAKIVGGFAFSLLISLIAIIKKQNLNVIYHFNNCLYLTMIVLATFWGDITEGQILWCYTYPLMSIFLFGNRIGIKWSFLLLISVLCILWQHRSAELSDSLNFEIRFIVSYLTILLITSWLEYYRCRYTEKFNNQKNDLINEREYLTHEIERRIDLEDKLNKLANEDGLTSLYNRRYFLSSTKGEILRAKKNKNPLSMAIIDLDHFKAINDKHGHPVGDEVLKCFSDKCMQYFSSPQLLGRMGGEEFSILLPNTSLDTAQKMLDKFRQDISKYSFSIHGIDINLTISIGLSQINYKYTTVDLLYSACDKALYEAKRSGRNRVEITK